MQGSSGVDSTKSVAQQEHDHVFGMILASYASQVVRTLSSLSVAEQLDDGALTAHQIHHHASSDPDMTYRLLRAAVGFGFLEYDKATETFAATSRLGILHPDSPFTLKHFAQALGGRGPWQASLRMPDAVRRGRNCTEEELGGDLWQFYAERNDEALTFRTAMTD